MVSVIIPSIRRENLKSTLKDFICKQSLIGYKIIVVADFPHPLDNVFPWNSSLITWICQSKKTGPVDAICQGIEAANGDYIFFINDQCQLSTGGLRKMVTFSKEHSDQIIVGHRNTPITPMSYYGVEFEPYPLIHINLIKRLGGYYRPIYRHFYADPDLAMRAHEKGVRILKSPGVSVHRICDGSMAYNGHAQNVSAYYKQDMETFKNQWKYIENCGKPFREISPGRRSWLWCRLLELLPY